MEIKTKLTMRAMIRWEQMTGRPFRNVDFADEEDVRKVLYCASVTYAEKPYTYREFCAVMRNPRWARSYAKSLAQYNEYAAQFIHAVDNDGGESSHAAPCYFGEVAASLIVNGLDAHFVLDEMTVGDIPLYVEALNEKIKHEEESRRLWTYLSVLPHVGSKKMRSPQALYKFPWENQRHKVTRAERNRAVEEFKEFMDGKIN